MLHSNNFKNTHNLNVFDKYLSLKSFQENSDEKSL